MSKQAITLQSFERKFNSISVKIDKRFQRRSVWTLADKRQYLHSLSKNWVQHQNIVVADVAACLEYSQAKDPSDNHSYEYFNDILDGGFKYLSLDGQNRTACLNEFMNNGLRYKGEMLDADGKTQHITNHTLEEMPQRVQDLLKTTSLISVEIVEELTSHDLRKFFLSYNGGCPLKPQERRHAEPTPLSEWVENRAQKYQKSGAASKLYTKGDISRMKDNELITKLTMALIHKVGPNSEDVQAPFGLKTGALDEFYRIGNDAFDMANSCYDATEMSRASDIIDTTMRIVAAHPNNTSMSDLWALLWAVEYAHDNNKTIQSLAKFRKQVMEIDKKLKEDSEQRFARDVLQAQKANTVKMPNLSNYYHRQAALPHEIPARLGRRNALVQELSTSVNRYKLTLK